MSAATKTPKQKIIDNAVNAVGGKPVCDPKAPCQPCHRTDLHLLVVLPSVVAREHNDALKQAGYAWAPSFDAEFGDMKREATVPVARIMRQGYLYLYYVHRNCWDVWQVMSNGLTRKIMHQVDKDRYAKLQPGFASAQEPKLCSQGAANLPAHLISESGSQTTDQLWLAFSSILWTPATLQRYADNPEVDSSDGKPAGKKKLRDLRGREISPKGILGGKFPAKACLPLNAAALERHLVDFAKQADFTYEDAFEKAKPPLAKARIGKATAFDQTVRALERACAPAANPELYLNKSVILMVPDAAGIADAHNNCRLQALSDRQGWMAGGPDAHGNNADRARPWQRQSLLQAGWIREWERNKARAVHKERLAQGGYRTQTVISGFEYQKILEQEKRTGEPVNPDGTTYERLPGQPERYRVTWPKAYVDEGIEGLAQADAKGRIERYDTHLDQDKIEAANKKWQDQEAGWTALLESRDTDYVRWLESPVHQAMVRYDFDDDMAVSKTQRTAEQVRIDAREAADRLRTLATCYGGGICSGVSLKYLIEMFNKSEADKSHFIAQAMFREFNLLDKIAGDSPDQGVRADLYDALIAKRDIWEQFHEAWHQVREEASKSNGALLLVGQQVVKRMQEMALLPELAQQRGLKIALADAAAKQVVWARAAGFASFLQTGQRHYVVGAKWTEGTFAAALNEPTLHGAAFDVAQRKVTGKQARRAAKQSRAALRSVVARNTAEIDTTVMLVLDEPTMAKIAGARGEKMLQIVSPGLFGLPQGVANVPESMAREIVRNYPKAGWSAFKSGAMGLNIGALLLQQNALIESWENLTKTGGLDQRDAFFSMLGSVAGVTGAMTEIAAMILTPVEKKTLGTPAAAVLNKVPAHLWLRYASGIMLAAGSFFDAAVAYVKSRTHANQGDIDSANAYKGTMSAQLVGGISLGLGAFYAHRARALAYFGEQAVVRVLAGSFSAVQVARCFTGVGLALWIAGLGVSFYAMYLEDDDNEIFLRRSYFGKGHPQLGKFKDLDEEVQSFGALALGTRAEMEWHDEWGPDELVVKVRVFQPTPNAVVTALLQGFDDINGKQMADLYKGDMPALSLGSDDFEARNDIHTTEYRMKLPGGVEAVKLLYAVYEDRTRGRAPMARGDMWVED